MPERRTATTDETVSKRDERVRKVVAKYARGSILLHRAQYVTEQEIRTEAENVTDYDF